MSPRQFAQGVEARVTANAGRNYIAILIQIVALYSARR
jgi:hypothetical protein